jgi:diaminopimelate decarboxylase
MNASISAPTEQVIREQVSRGHDPFYLYDTSLICSVCRKLAALPYPLTSVHFACMANAHPTFLRVVREEGLNLFVNSPMHLNQALASGFSGTQIVYAGSAMDEPTMRTAHDAGAVVNLDSLGQVALWLHLFPDAPFGIRCNIGELVEAKKTRGGYFIGKESRLGLTPDEILSLSGNRLVAGLHLYVGTDICSLDYFHHCYMVLAEFARAFPGLTYLDVGGGFGLKDEQGREFDFVGYGTMADSFMRHVCIMVGKPVRMIIEPGRIIGARAGWFVCRVTDVKQRGGWQLIGVNASSVQFPRPLFYPDSAKHPVTLLHADPSLNGNPELLSSVCGCSTYSRDFLARDVQIPRARVGDIIVLGDAGSYCASAYTHFLGFPQPKEIFHDCATSSRQERTTDILCDAEESL